MPLQIATITLPLPYGLGTVNCYLIKTEIGYLLVDTGCSNQRIYLEQELERIGCKPGNLKLIILTHGDFDHSCNAAYLRHKFASKIAMHYGDLGMVEHGDIFWNRKEGNILIKIIARMLFQFGESARFKPDLYIKEGDNLSAYGCEAKIIEIPGHSQGSIGILTNDGDLFCGDLFTNIKKPILNTIMDNLEVANNSVRKLKSLAINTIYPGHGEAFKMALLQQEN